VNLAVQLVPPWPVLLFLLFCRQQLRPVPDQASVGVQTEPEQQDSAGTAPPALDQQPSAEGSEQDSEVEDSSEDAPDTCRVRTAACKLDWGCTALLPHRMTDSASCRLSVSMHEICSPIFIDTCWIGSKRTCKCSAADTGSIPSERCSCRMHWRLHWQFECCCKCRYPTYIFMCMSAFVLITITMYSSLNSPSQQQIPRHSTPRPIRYLTFWTMCLAAASAAGCGWSRCWARSQQTRPWRTQSLTGRGCHAAA
jgi:hypothetical protein